MKHSITVRRLIVGVVVTSILTFSGQGQSQRKDDGLEIKGIQLTLGMTQDLVFSKLRERNLTVAKMGTVDNSWAICDSPESTACEPMLGQISFKDDRLVLVLKRWTDTKNITDLVS